MLLLLVVAVGGMVALPVAVAVVILLGLLRFRLVVTFMFLLVQGPPEQRLR
jgi:hypothetical protein